MAIGDDEVTTCNSQLNSDDESDDDVNSFIKRLHDSLKEFYTRNKELKQTINFLIQNNANLFRQNKNLKDKNDNLKRLETDLHVEIDRKIKFCEMLKKEQGDLKRRIDNLNELFQHKKQSCFQKNEPKPYRGGIHEKKLNSSSYKFTIYKRRQVRFVKSIHTSNSLTMCNFVVK